MDKIKYILFIAFCCCLTTVVAQKRISGHVYNPKDGPVMMANVVEIDNNNRIVEATTTDMNGNFSMTIKNPKNFLQVSYIGYRTFKQEIGSTTTFRIVMDDAQTLKEVKVVGKKQYKSGGLTIPEREVSVAQQTLNMDEMQGLSFETADQALQGQIAGLDIVANSGNLGAGTSMRLRGTTTINGNQEPLIVVDGNILESYNKSDIDLQDMDNSEQFAQLLSVNPEDIQSINVLKDAAATAIWGSRGANGVIQITTRRGKRGKTKVDFSYRFTGSWQPEGLNMLNGDGYTMMLKEAYFNPKQNSVTSTMPELDYNKDYHNYYNFNKNTDWVNEVTQFGQTHNYGINLTGGGEKALFRVSGNYDSETGTIIKQSLDRFSTRMVLDYYVSDRITFRSNFALTYTSNNKNYAGILDKAYAAMPNMAITRHERVNGEEYDTGEYYKMLKLHGTPWTSMGEAMSLYESSKYLEDMVGNGNPIAIANLAWLKEKTYKITPQFQVEYKLLGKSDDETRLDYTGEVYLDAFTQSTTAYYPAELTNDAWDSEGGNNLSSDDESKYLSFTTRHTLAYTPKFKNEDHYLTAMIRGEMSTNNGNSQSMSSRGLNSGITDPTVDAFLRGAGSSISKGHSMGFVGSVHYSYKGKYAMDVTMRADGSTKFGAGNKWGYFPGLSGRWNISDELFMQPLKNVISMLAFRPGWGIVGNQPGSDGLMYNRYSASGIYGKGSYQMNAIAPANLRLVDLKWEKTTSWNLGFNLGLFEDLLNFDLNVYGKNTKDLLMKDVRIPSSTGFSTLDWANVGEMENTGWELNFFSGKFLKVGKFSMSAKFNLAQNVNQIKAMDAAVLSSLNADFNYDPKEANRKYNSRVQVGNALGGIYGFRFKGVYRYDYDHSGYFADESKNNLYGANTAAHAAAINENSTCPIAKDANGNIIFDGKGNPLPMYFNYGGQNYQFQGGDVIYEDINHDGQINELDMVYLGSSNPTLNGGFGLDFNYGRWTLKTSFNFRVGSNVINLARQKAEDMRTNNNQSSAVNWRWRKNGDETVIPRAMNSGIMQTFNSLPNDRYVEKGDYLRLQYIQLSYSFDPKKLKQFGMNAIRLSASGNNLIFWSKYTGTDPEHSANKWDPAIDNSQTPRSRSFTLSLNVTF